MTAETSQRAQAVTDRRDGGAGSDADEDGGAGTTADDAERLAPETVDGFPPGAKLVLKVLEYGGPLTQKQIAEESRLPPRTVRESTARLQDAGLVEERPSLRDARQSIYTLRTERLPAE